MSVQGPTSGQHVGPQGWAPGMLQKQVCAEPQDDMGLAKSRCRPGSKAGSSRGHPRELGQASVSSWIWKRLHGCWMRLLSTDLSLCARRKQDVVWEPVVPTCLVGPLTLSQSGPSTAL